MSITLKEKELVSVGASVATGCKPCTNYHFKKVKEAGASDDEIKQAISYAMAVRDSAREIMENHGLKHLGIKKDKVEPVCAEKTTRIKELVSIAAAFAVNCTTNLKKHMAAGRTLGLTEKEIESVLDVALFIKDEAAHYVDQIVKLKEKSDRLQQLLDELQQTQARLVQSEKMASLGKLVAGIVHEMNTPIGTINSAVDVSARSVSNILEILEKSQNLDEIKNNRQLQDSLIALQNNNPVTIAASERITKIIKSLKSFSRIDESTFQKTDLHVEIVDTGIGIPPKKMQRLFDPGFTKKGSRIKAGIGLFTSYNIIQRHQGQINVDSEIGKGSTFTIILPKNLEETSQVAETADADTSADRCSRLK